MINLTARAMRREELEFLPSGRRKICKGVDAFGTDLMRIKAIDPIPAFPVLG